MSLPALTHSEVQAEARSTHYAVGRLAHPGQKGVVVQPQPGGGGEVEPRVGQPRARVVQRGHELRAIRVDELVPFALRVLHDVIG